VVTGLSAEAEAGVPGADFINLHFGHKTLRPDFYTKVQNYIVPILIVF
jgi:hypothetical protein